MNIWVCLVIGVLCAVAYKGYQKYRENKIKKELEKLNNSVNDNKNQTDNVVVETEDNNK